MRTLARCFDDGLATCYQQCAGLWVAGSLLARSRKNAAGPVGGSGAVAGGEDEPDWKMYSLTGAGSKNSCTVMTADGFEINSDTPKNMGGTNHAPQPVYLLLAALAGCETATAHYVARQMRIRVHGVAFDLRGWRDQRGALCRPLEAIDTCEVPSHLQASVPPVLPVRSPWLDSCSTHGGRARSHRGVGLRQSEECHLSEPASVPQVIEGTAAVDTEATQEQIDELAHQVHRRCPIASMLIASGCRLDIKWVKATPG